MKINNYNEVVSLLRPHLSDYLEEHGYDTSKNFLCINPNHKENTPSCNVLKNNPEVFHCFSCGAEGTGDIFTACHFLEGRPLSGREFILDKVLYLAEKYGVEVDQEPPTEAELYEIDTYRAYKYAANYVASCNITENFEKVLINREWTRDICSEYGVGTVDDYRKFREYLKSLGFAAGFLDDIDLSREDIFNPNNLIFTIRDEIGRPVGFSARNLLYTADKMNGPKYNNSRTTGVKCNIYRKSARLYGFDSVLHKHSKKDLIYIFEGYSDVISAAVNGVTNCVALSGVNFSPEQLYLLKDYGFYNICLMLDADEAGQSRTMDILDTTLSNQRDLKVSIVCLPEGNDPDDFFRAEGARGFKKLRHWSAFEWRLHQFIENTEPEIVCEKMVSIIANETSAVKRDKLEKQLADFTHMSAPSIHKDVERLLNSLEMEKLRERQNILDKLRYSIDRHPDEAEVSITEAENKLFELAKTHNEDCFSEERYLFDLKTQKEEEENKDGSFSGFLLGHDLKPFEKALCGEWKSDVWGCIGGGENVGKSALMLKICFSISNIEENNAICLYHSIDDTKGQLLPRCVCLAEGSRRLTINKIRDPNWWIKSGRENGEILKFREKGYDKLSDMGKNGRFILKDANDGYSLSYVERLIRYYKDKYPDKNMVYVLDNFHKLQDFETIKGDERVRYKTMSTVVKNLATRHHICILSTVEYTKLAAGTVPTNNNIGETRQIAYDANLLVHMYSDLHELGDKAKHFHISLNGENEAVKMPRVMVNFGKNKISPFKGRQWYDFYPEQSDFVYVDERIMEEAEEQEEEKKNRFQKIAENGLTE
jgi:DNA primase catalytic core